MEFYKNVPFFILGLVFVIAVVGSIWSFTDNQVTASVLFRLNLYKPVNCVKCSPITHYKAVCKDNTHVLNTKCISSVFGCYKLYSYSTACPSGQTCNNGACMSTLSTCTPKTCAVQGKNCGLISDGCGGTLNCGSNTQSCSSMFGTCSISGIQSCINGNYGGCTSTDPRLVNCAGKTCGSDGCGGNCGTCTTGQICTNGNCVASCIHITSCPASTSWGTCLTSGQQVRSCSNGCGGTITETQTCTPTISACGEITSSGNYVLSADLSESDKYTSCLNIHDTNNVNIDCQGHAITGIDKAAIQLGNVHGFSFKNCLLNNNINDAGYTQGVINIFNSDTGIITTNTVNGIYSTIMDSHDIHVTNNNFNSFIQFSTNSFTPGQQIRTSYNNIIENNNINIISIPNTSPVGGIISNNGNNNIIRNNVIDGKSNTLASFDGLDDGVILGDEFNDVVENNQISNVWDCGIETTGTIQNSDFNQNNIKRVGLCAIGAWYDTSWIGNKVNNNVYANTNMPYTKIFNFFISYPAVTGTRTFSNNVFTGNSVTNPGYFTLFIDWENWITSNPPAVVSGVGQNNVFTNNDFNGIVQFMPWGSTMFVDGGGNKCTQHPNVYQYVNPLTCI